MHKDDDDDEVRMCVKTLNQDLIIVHFNFKNIARNMRRKFHVGTSYISVHVWCK